MQLILPGPRKPKPRMNNERASAAMTNMSRNKTFGSTPRGVNRPGKGIGSLREDDVDLGHRHVRRLGETSDHSVKGEILSSRDFTALYIVRMILSECQ